MHTVVKGRVSPFYQSGDSNQKRLRHIREHRRLEGNCLALIKAHPMAEVIGPDMAVEALAARHQFERHDLVINYVRVEKRSFTVICVPNRLSHRPSPMDRLLELKRTAKDSGRACVLIPETFVQ